MLVDSHCHLGMMKEDIDVILSNAKESGVKYLLNICTKSSEVEDIINTSKKYENVFGSVGVHPQHSAEDKVTCEQLTHFATRSRKIIGFGETGLDYYYEHSPISCQRAIFGEHIGAAQSHGLPIIIHCRSADLDMIDILSSEMRNKCFNGLIHCFTGTKQLAYKALDLGLYISVSGIITFAKALELKEIVAKLPIDRLLVETDSPYLAPDPMRGKQNEPSFVKFIAEKLATLKNTNFEHVAATTTNNFCNLFKIHTALT